MNAEEYKATRERLGMTQAALAEALDVSRKAINQREQGGTITREAAMALELLAQLTLRPAFNLIHYHHATTATTI